MPSTWLNRADGVRVDRQGVMACCGGLRGALEDYPFGPETPVFKVGGKVFAIVGPSSVSLKCDPAYALALRQEYPAVTPGYHLNKRHWNTVALDGSIDDAMLREWIEDSYDLVLSSLPRARRQALLA